VVGQGCDGGDISYSRNENVKSENKNKEQLKGGY